MKSILFTAGVIFASVGFIAAAPITTTLGFIAIGVALACCK